MLWLSVGRPGTLWTCSCHVFGCFQTRENVQNGCYVANDFFFMPGLVLFYMFMKGLHVKGLNVWFRISLNFMHSHRPCDLLVCGGLVLRSVVKGHLLILRDGFIHQLMSPHSCVNRSACVRVSECLCASVSVMYSREYIAFPGWIESHAPSPNTHYPTSSPSTLSKQHCVLREIMCPSLSPWEET